MSKKQKLELTWIGKEKRQSLEYGSRLPKPKLLIPEFLWTP